MILDPDSMSQQTKDALTAVLGEEAFEPATQEALQEEVAQIGAMMDTWKSRDVESFDQIYDKDAILNSDDELNSKLFTDRDPGMIAYADEYLKREEMCIRDSPCTVRLYQVRSRAVRCRHSVRRIDRHVHHYVGGEFLL